MIQVFVRFFTLNVFSTHPAVYWGMGAAWIILLFSALLSLRATPLSTSAKLGWFAFIFLFPIVGLAIYCGYCLAKGNWSFLKTLVAQPRIVKSVQTK